jgi:ABC-type Fe3+/spermidine/putrescine transport system ATPase subunit
LDAVDRATDILFLDDPLAGRDILDRERVLSKVKDTAAEKQIAIVYATSDFETAALVGDEIAALEAGMIGQTGSPEAIYETPRTRFIASITGRCNIFEARRLTSSKLEIPEFQTIKGEHRLFAEKADIAKLGSINRNISLAIRPENISISFGASFPEDNLLRAMVIGIRYLGTTTAIDFDCSGLKLEAIVFRLIGLNLGDECMLGLPPDRIRILKD